MKVNEKDAAALAGLVKIVWPEHTPEELARIIVNYICSENSAIFAEIVNGEYVGVALCCLRNDYVEGCETSPVGYLEGVSVKEDFRNQGVAKRLVEECEQWAREKGCTEFASDCELTNTESRIFHLAIGFQEQNRIVCFKKML